MEKNTALKWIFDNSKNYIRIITVLTITMGLISVAYIILAAIASNVLDIATGKKMGNIWVDVIYIFSLIIVQALLNIFYSNLKIRISGKLEISFKKRLFYYVLQKDYLKISEFHSGEILNRMTSDIQQITSTIVILIPQIFGIAAKISAGILVTTQINFHYAIIMLITGSIFSVLGRMFSSKFKLLHKLVQKSDGKTRSFIQECIENIMVIKAYKSNSIMIEKLDKLQMLNYKAKINWNAATNLSKTLSYVFFTFAYFLTLTWGAIELSKGIMTFGDLTAILLIFEQIKNPILNMSGILPQYYAMLASAERLIDIENLKSEEINYSNMDIKNIYENLECIDFTNLSFTYGSKLIIKNLNLSIKKGEIIALVGKSGIGKSTFFKLMLGLVNPTVGEILLKTDNKTIKINSITREFFALVPQGNFVISGTIKENICFSAEIDESRLIESAIAACIYDDILNLPNGFNSIIGENGTGLSQGQLQRIAIARAIYSNCPIILLDESTSALDEITEAQVLCNLNNLEDRMMFFISHRESTFKICDRVVLFEEGIIKEI